jgi:hypothetical protein
MPWTYRIDEERRLVVTTAWNKITGTEAVEHQRKLLDDRSFARDFFQLVDASRVTEIQIDRVTVAQLARLDLFSAKSRRAFLAPSPLAYGVARMFMAFREAHGGEEQMQVFKERDAALHWLGIAPFD